MSSVFQNAKLTAVPAYFAPAPLHRLERFEEVFEENRHRIYAIAFWMTDNEMEAEQVLSSTFQKVFSSQSATDPETIDRALISELRKRMSIGPLVLRSEPSQTVVQARRNTRRVDLERAVVQLPTTERLVFLMHDVEKYDFARIARLVGLSEEDAQQSLHEARLQIRELLVKLNS